MPEPITDLVLRVQPGSSRNSIMVLADGTIKVWVTTPPVEGAANEAVCRLVAKTVGLPFTRVQVVSGHHHRNKTLRLAGVALDEALAKLKGGSA
jgi:uncharacterized protein (TIGR00251 family)